MTVFQPEGHTINCSVSFANNYTFPLWCCNNDSSISKELATSHTCKFPGSVTFLCATPLQANTCALKICEGKTGLLQWCHTFRNNPRRIQAEHKSISHWLVSLISKLIQRILFTTILASTSIIFPQELQRDLLCKIPLVIRQHCMR